MTSRTVLHDTFTIERIYQAPPSRVFAAWSDEGVKARWFAPDATDHTLDFRVGGAERNRGGGDLDGPLMSFDSVYHDIVDDEVIVFSSSLFNDDDLVTVSLTTVELHPVEAGTRLVLTQHNVFFDGHERPEWRQDGTNSQLDALGTELIS